MATNFPTSLDTFVNPTGSDTSGHIGMHTKANDAIAALEAKVGVDGSAVTTSLDYKVKFYRNVVAKTANWTLVSADHATFYTVTGDSIVVTLPSAAAVTSGWFVTINNDNTNTTAAKLVTINRAGSDTVDGSTTIYLAPRTTLTITRTSSTTFNLSGNESYGWRDLVGQIVVRGSGAQDPSFVNIPGSTNMYAYEFPTNPASNKQFWVNYHIDHDYAFGTPIYLHVHWINAAATPNTGVVRWGFEYSVAKGHQQQAFNLTSTTTVYVEQTCNATRYMHHIAEISVGDAIPATNLEPDSIIMTRIFRDTDSANDTNTDSVFPLLVDCHYLSDRLNTPNKAPAFYN
jgi:hypothetical protein